MIAINHAPPIQHRVHCPVRKAVFGEFAAHYLYHGLVRDFAESEDGADIGQRLQRACQKWAAGADFHRGWLVLGRQAFDGVEDHRAFQRYAVIRAAIVNPIDQPEFSKRGEQQIAREVASKGPPGAVGAVFPRCKADDGQPRFGIAKSGDWRVPKGRELCLASGARFGEAGAKGAIMGWLNGGNGAYKCHEWRIGRAGIVDK